MGSSHDKVARPWLVILFLAVVARATHNVSFSAYRLRLAHGAQPPVDPYSSVDHWQVEELFFATDAACQSKLTIDRAIASVSSSRSSLAFDGDVATRWTASCTSGEDPFDQCQASFTDGAWLGAELSSSAIVMCVGLAHSTTVDGMILEGWSASNDKWLALQEFGKAPASDTMPIRLQRLWGGACGETSLSDARSGSMNSLSGNLGANIWIPSCESGSQWRFIANEATKTWVVYEFELYKDDRCRDLALESAPITSDDQPERAQRLHDGSLATAWTASCTDGAGEGPCDKNQLWVGLSFPRSEAIGCVRVYQSYEAAAEEIRGEFTLSMWDGESWLDRISFASVENGEWSYLSQQADGNFTRWRLVNTAKIDSSWAVHELEFMADAVCTERIPGGLPISSAVDGSKAFDNNKETVWVSQCTPCEPNMAYLGQIFETPTLVRCVSLRQGGDIEYIAESAALEMWVEDMGVFRWTSVRSYEMLLPGLNKLSLWWGESGTRFKVSNLGAAPGGWRVGEIRLFSDYDCADRISGMGFSSDADPEDAQRAFDGDVTSFWHASCCAKLSTDVNCLGCDSIGAWIGFTTIWNTSVNCMQIIQKGARQPRGPMKFASSSISLQGWDKDSESYLVIYEWQNLPGDDWVELSVGRDHSADSISCKDNQDWERCNASGWNCSRYKEEDMCNETFQSDADCGGIEMSFACKEGCCLCGESNAAHCPREAEEEVGLPAWLIPLVSGFVGAVCMSCVACCISWKKKFCHHKQGCRHLCTTLDRLLMRK